ncbi:MAG: 30S ribosomal protein S3 [Candidatus Liptonbacteria bacterium]|nr:30S ribosomal protein S3 [Candidatus Liptonbacteria bacterium]
MGQKINPQSFRSGITRDWPVRWFVNRGYKKFLEEDEAVRRVIKSKISQAGIVSVEINRTSNKLRITIKSARPGLIIGRGGKGIEDLTKSLEKELKKLRGGKLGSDLSVTVEELKRSEISAQYTAEQIAWDFEKRLPFRRTIKKYLDLISQNKAVKGAKIQVAGRLDGNEIARREHLKSGSLPLQTLRADIDYGHAVAYTTYGTIGVKVWIYKGEIHTNIREEKN